MAVGGGPGLGAGRGRSGFADVGPRHPQLHEGAGQGSGRADPVHPRKRAKRRRGGRAGLGDQLWTALISTRSPPVCCR